MSIKKTIPNILTIMRIGGVIFATVLLFQNNLADVFLALMIYLLVALTDFFDGYLARKWDAVTTFGKIMDPIADKVYILTLYVSFVFLGVISHWWVWPIIIREISVTVIRLILLKRGSVIAAERSGKIKTFTQNISVFLLLAVFIVTLFIYNSTPSSLNPMSDSIMPAPKIPASTIASLAKAVSTTAPIVSAWSWSHTSKAVKASSVTEPPVSESEVATFLINTSKRLPSPAVPSAHVHD
ncbi:CDP-diacylglycerol--glycerol-3-phosphate 3-phosphatidyltransferase [Candidatus Omnitrophota bacterium]